MTEGREALEVRTRPRFNAPRTIEVNGVETVFYEAGSGETIVFIYGGQPGSSEASTSAHVWDLTCEALAGRLRVVAYDKIGQGESGLPLRDEDYTMAAVVRHAAGFVDALGAPCVHLVGHSRGGYAATRLALERPDLVKSLTIVASGTLSPTISTNEMNQSGNPHPAYSRAASRWVYESYCHDPRAVTEDWVDRSYEMTNLAKNREAVRKMVTEKLGFRYFLPELARQKRETLNWLREGRLQRPVQIVWGGNDKTVALHGGIGLFEMIGAHQPRTELAIFNHCGHFPYREHPARFNALLAGFVAETSGGAG